MDGARIPVEAKLLRFYRDNGDIEPAAYATVYSPFSNSLITDAEKLAEGGFEASGGLLGLYYEPAEATPSNMDIEKLVEKVTREVDYWFGLTLTTQGIAHFSELRHPVHQQGAAITWELVE